jgi:hypothetical protein
MAKKTALKKISTPDEALLANVAEKKAPARKRAAKKAPVDQDIQAAAAATLTIDYPQEGEAVTAPQYTVRVTVPEGAPFVDVSVDKGEWQPCRFAVGHWWFDWAGYSAGQHTLRARVVGPDGNETIVSRKAKVQ